MRGNADNRITEVETSADAQNWHHDARYFYYPHGPLQRVELGEHLVQGADYAYTLQGWLKGINGDRLNPTTDMGRDGDATVVDNPNLLTGRDAYALSLGYYGDNDYKAITPNWSTVATRAFAPVGASGTMNTEHTPLYNGNIAHTVNTLQHFGLWDATNGDQGQVLAMVYRYDQLNRLRTARGIIGLGTANTWNTVADAATNRYRSEYTYDANGNIKTVDRWDSDQNHYDEFAYKYEKRGGRVVRNRLYQLNDIADQPNTYVNEAGGAQDIGWTGNVAFNEENPAMNTAYNYGYDALGNLVRDTREGITNIDWTVAGKVRSVAKATGPSLAFAYGASGQRTQKQVGDPALDPNAYREHYIRDAQGNIMATYRYTNNAGASLKLNERPLYGSSRLGSLRKEVELHTLAAFDPTSANPVQMVDLNYELTDHLGNVCAVVTGRLLDGNGGGTAKQAELVSAQGYEPFGAMLPGRNYSSGSYSYLFQGQEHDDELYGSVGTSYAFEFRMHDSRVGKFWSVDPLAMKYPWNSTYAFSENRVLDMVELEGLEAEPTEDKKPYAGGFGFENHGDGTATSPMGDKSIFRKGSTKIDTPPFGSYGENLTPPSVQSYKISPRGTEQPVIEDKRGQVPDDYIAKYVRWTVETSAWMQQNTGGKNKPLLRVTATLKNVTVSDGSPFKVASIATLFGEDGSILGMKHLSTPPNSFSLLGSVGVADFKLASPNTQGILPSYRLEVETILQVNVHGSWYTPTRIGTLFVPNTSITDFRISSNPF